MVRSLCVIKWVFMGMLTVLCVVANAQAIQPGPILFKKPIQPSSLSLSGIDPSNSAMKVAAVGNQTKVFLQFQSIPDSRKKQVLHARGIDLLDYIPENVFLANVRGKWSAAALKEIGITATIPFENSFKLDNGIGNVYAKSSQSNFVSGKFHLVISPEYDSNQVRQMIAATGKDGQLAANNILFLNKRLAEIELKGNALDKILGQPFVLYVMPARNMMPLNSDATDNLTAQVVQRGGNGVPGLSGKGVVMGVGDEGRADHIDNGYNEEGQDYNSGYHSTHVAGTMIGAGIVNPYMKGFAPKSTLIVDFFNNIIYRAPEYYQKKRMVLTNNSYGAGSYCVPYSGEYSGYSGQADQQLLDYPNMMHVFAAGNSGDLQCGDFPIGYRSIDNSFQAAKNVITVGGTSHDGLTNKFSRGPVNDGRIKPEISGIGNAMMSTIMDNAYGSNQGTSMSAPQITGALALVYERYRQLNGDLDPPGDLAKAIICNTATDIETKGVDFSTGFGWLNLKKAIGVVNDKSYRSGSVENNQEQTIELNLDKEVFDFKVMLYWHDQPSSYYTLKNLVNDLDLTVTLPDGSVYDPFVLDTSATGVTKPAVMGKDHINNIEQVVIEHAFPGRYTIRVKGYKVPFGPQAFKIVYNWQEPGLQLVQPIGGESWKPGEKRGIHWQDAGHDGDVYSFDYSLDNGASWINIPGISGTYNRVDWTLPAVQSAAARIRITNTVSGKSSISNPFAILPEINFTINSTCSSEVLVKWSKPAGIDSVAVLLYQSGEYVVQTITADTSWLVKGLRSGPSYWISLQPMLQGIAGERSIGQKIITPNTNCLPGGPAGDMAIQVILLPPTGREGTSTEPVGPVPVKVQLINTGNTNVSDSIFLDIVKDGSPLGKDTLVKNFTGGEEYNWTTRLSFLPVAGSTTTLAVSFTVAGDTNILNNHKDSTWRYLSNTAIVLPYADDFKTLKDSVYYKPGIIGIPGADHWDFQASSAAVYLATSEGFTSVCKIEGQSMELTGTFNMAGFSPADNIRAKLDIPSRDVAGISIYIRGTDNLSWLLIPVPDAISGIDDTKNLDISGVLAKGNQNFSSSFQVKLVGSTNSYVQELNMLKSFSLFTVTSDLALIDLNYTQARVTDGDSMHIVVSAYNKKLTVNGPFTIGLTTPDGLVRTVAFDSLGANKTASAPFNVAVQGWPNSFSPVTAWVHDPADIYPDDDSLQATIAYYRKISEFPYLQGFESGEAGWGRTFLYALSDKLTESVAPFTAANGKNFWGTRRVNYSDDVAFPVSAGYLVSPLFDIAAMKKPWLSMSVNKQLCDGLDSIVLQYSQDTGRTWKNLPSGPDTKNWYDAPGQGSWKNCGNDYWQVVSTPLPLSGKGLMLRVLLRGANSLADEFPRLPGGLLVDDVHVFDLSFPVYDDKKAVAAPATASENGFSYFTESGKVIAAAAAGSLPAGNRAQLSAPMAEPYYQGNRVLPKSWFFNGQQGAASGSRVRLYFSHDEVMAWLSAIPCDTCQQKRSPYDLSVFRYQGPDALVNATTADNTPGYSTSWAADAFDLVPYAAGYYAELPADAYGEFYIGLDEKGNDLNFRAERQDGANIVLLNWNLANISGISRFEVERAARTAGNPVFEQIGLVAAVANTLEYGFRDTRIHPPGAWHYRLKIVYANGDIRYSPLRTISFESQVKAKLYPNPSTDGKVSLLLQNAEGKKVDLALYDQSGRWLWGKSLPPVAQQQLVPLVAGDGRLPNGVYVLKISTGSEKLSIQFVISRN